MVTPANRMITVSRSSGLLPTTTEQHWQMTTEQCWQMQVDNLLLSDPQRTLYQRFGRLFEEAPIQDVRKMGIFDAVSDKIRDLEEITSEFYKRIWENKEDICKDPVMKDLVREFIIIILDTLKLCNGLAKCLSVEKAKHDIIKNVLNKAAPPGISSLSEAQMSKVTEKLMDFLQHEDPFKDLHQQYEPLLERYKQLRDNLADKIKEVSGKRKVDKVWTIVSGTLMAAVTAAAAVSCVVVAVVAPPTAPAAAAASTLYAATMGFLGHMMLSSRGKEKNHAEAKQLAEKIEKHTSVTQIELGEIINSVGGLNRFREPIVLHVESCMKDHDILNLADTAKHIKELEEQLSKNLDGLVKKVDCCLDKLTEQIQDLKKLLL